MILKQNKEILKNITRLIFKCVIMFIPVLWGWYIVTRYGINMFFQDEWTYIDNYDNFWTLNYLCAPHNEHRMFFSKILTFIIGEIFSWSSKAFMYTSQILMLFLYALSAQIILGKEKFQNITWIHTIEVFVIGTCIYNTCQWENFLWGFQIAWFMIASLGAASFYSFDKYLKSTKKPYLLIALILSVIVSFSSFHGLAIWGAWLVVFICLIISKEKIPFISVVSTFATAICSIFLYFLNYHAVSGHKEFLGEGTDDILAYFIAQIGASMLPHDTPLSYLIGFIVLIIMILMCVYLIMKKNIKININCIGPMIMGCGAMFAVAIGRSGGDTGEFVSPRYTTNSMLFLTFFLIMAFRILKEHCQESKEIEKVDSVLKPINNTLITVVVVLCIALPLLIISRNLGEIENVKDAYKSRLHAKIVLCNYESASLEEIRTFCPANSNSLEHFKERFSFIKEKKLNTFHDDIETLVFREKEIPQDGIRGGAELSNYYTFNHANIVINNQTLSVFVCDLDGIEINNLNKFNYYLIINEIPYQMVLDTDCIRFFCSLDKLLEGINELQFVFSDNDVLGYSKKICVLKEGTNVIVADTYQQDMSILEGYNKIEAQRNLCIDRFNGEAPSVETAINNNTIASINGWVQVENPQSKKCYLRINQGLFELNWERRDDVVAAFQDINYSGFTGNFIPLTIESGEYDMSFIILDNDEMTYTDQKIFN